MPHLDFNELLRQAGIGFNASSQKDVTEMNPSSTHGERRLIKYGDRRREIPRYEDSKMLLCPSCREPSIEDPELVTIHHNDDEYTSPLGTRGGWVEIDLYCSCGHTFAFIIGNHKGAQMIGLVQIEGWDPWADLAAGH